MSWRSRSLSTKGAEAFEVKPFVRLARTHALSVGGDALLAIALADSLFFNVDPNDARWKVATYLVLTIAPFAVVAPVLGPLMDRLKGGHRYMVIGSLLVRAMVMFALVRYIHGPVLFPLAFTMLVMGKTYAVAKSALVPSMVKHEADLVRSNARLSVLAGFSSAAAGIPGVILLTIGGSALVLSLGGAVFVLGIVMATQIPSVKVATSPPEAQERAELRSAGVVLAASATGYLRGVVGFITLLLAFELRGGIDPGPTETGVEMGHRVREALGLVRLDLTTGGAPPWHFGVALVGVGLGGLAGSLAVPRLRTRYQEERLLAFALFALAALAALAALSTGLAGAFLIGFAVALASTAGKQAFDAIVQRDAPEANLGRSFSRFESRFQLLWVIGALLPVVLPIPARIGYVTVVVSALFVGLSYWFGRHPNPKAMLSDEVLTSSLQKRLPDRVTNRARRVRDRLSSDASPKVSSADVVEPGEVVGDVGGDVAEVSVEADPGQP
ncbi:MAG: MFS transporter [Actinomycetia bacterium]|nr:MFS transporter [Actinomycetes bacterium]